jgi:dienelactone hydrolase
MNIIKVCFLLLCFCLSVIGQENNSAVSKKKLVSKMVEYGAAEKFEGYSVSAEDTKAMSPGILIIHNWMGVTEETKKQSDRFAELGYVVFAVDVYGKEIRPKDFKEAGSLAGKYRGDRKLFRERLLLGLEELKKLKNVDVNKLAVAGYCFGGCGAVELARSGAPILGAISFHGGLDSPTPADGKNIKGKILALCGGIDPYVPAKDIVAFEDEMNSNKVDCQIVRYSGTVHSFTDEGAGTDISKGAAYNKASDLRSFVAAQLFLTEVFVSVK